MQREGSTTQGSSQKVGPGREGPRTRVTNTIPERGRVSAVRPRRDRVVDASLHFGGKGLMPSAPALCPCAKGGLSFEIHWVL